MKTKNKNTRPFHLSVEYFFRHPYLLLAMLGLLSVAITKSDGKLIGMMRDAYAQGYGMIGTYLREETTRTPITVAISRIPTVTSK
ncbi:MAG TPA: hypothetical protein VIS56_02235 [Candidatus Saccharimonadales bacterium]